MSGKGALGCARGSPYSAWHLRRRATSILGGIAGGATPVPIPNTEVKPSWADGTALATAWESRSLPGLISPKQGCVCFGIPWTPGLVVRAFGFPRMSARAGGCSDEPDRGVLDFHH